MNTREKVLKEALNCVNGEREKQYGNPEDNFRRIADFWGLYLTTLFEDTGVVVELDPKDVAIMMILFKIARSLGDQDKLDNYVDMIGYAACGAEIFERSEEDSKKVEECVENSESILDRFADLVNARVRKKTEAKCLLDQKDPYSYVNDKLSNYVSVKAMEEHVPLEKLKDVNHKFSKELSDYLFQAATDCVENGKQFLDCYKEIDELFAKYKSNDKDAISAYVPKGAIETHKFVEDNRLSMDFDFEKSPKGRDIFNDTARAFISGIGNSNVKITTFEAPKDWYLHDVFMNETGQIIVRFNNRKAKELTGIPSCDECLYSTQAATDNPCNKCLCDLYHKPFFIPKNKENRATALPSGKSNLKCFRCIHRDISKNNYPCNECLTTKDKGMTYFTTNDTKFGVACCNCVHARPNSHNYPCNKCIAAYGSPYYLKKEDKK